MRIPNLDPVELVCSVLPLRRYHCPDVPTLDRHIDLLRRQVDADSNCTPEWKQHMRHDIDRLLDRRLYLTVVGRAETAA
jgi:hypothetical protein